MAVFVRKEVWVIREEREALKTFLEKDSFLTRELSIDEKERLLKFPSKFTNDAEFIMSFLSEVTRADEARGDSELGKDAISGNWVYQFSSFRDIVDGLRTILDLSGNARRKVLVANLKHEIETILSRLLERHDVGLKPITQWTTSARRSFQGGWDDDSSYKGDHLISLVMFLTSAWMLGNKPRMSSLYEAIVSGEFLEFHEGSKTLEVGLLQESLLGLQAELERAQFLLGMKELELQNAIPPIERLKLSRQGSFRVPNSRLTVVFALHDSIENILQLCKAIYSGLDGDLRLLDSARLNPSTPLETEHARMQQEAVSHDEVRGWLRS